jgi:hypothetical protein
MHSVYMQMFLNSHLYTTTEKWELNRMTYNLVQKLVETTGSVADMLPNCKIILTLSIGCVMKWLIHAGKRKMFSYKILGTAP